MGGGGAMRAAAKVAGFGVVNTSLRGFPSSSPSEHSFTSATRRSKQAVVSSSADETLNGNIEDSSVQKPLGEIGDWEFAGGNEEMFVGEYLPRLVFGGVPTLEEAQVATSELKEALEKTYLSPKSTGWTGSLISDKESGLQRLSNSEYLETKACVTTSDTTLTPVVPKHAMQAFMFLNQSTAAQSVVASIASDPNVWGAVMQNPKLVGFLKSYNTSSFLEKEESVVDDGFQDEHIPKDFDKSSNNEESGTGSLFTDSVKNIRLAVVEMMSCLSGYFQNIFGSPVGGKVPKEADGSDKITFVDTTLGASFMGLAIMVIMVVVLKRG